MKTIIFEIKKNIHCMGPMGECWWFRKVSKLKDNSVETIYSEVMRKRLEKLIEPQGPMVQFQKA